MQQRRHRLAEPINGSVLIEVTLRVLRHRTGLWRDRDFLKFWAGTTVSRFGSLLGALQFMAVVALDATPLQMGVLSAASVVPGVLIGFVAGVWVDRMRRKPVLIAADLGRTLSLASIPVAFFLGLLRMEQLYLVAFLNGILKTFFDIAFSTYVPVLVSRDRLVEANSTLTASESVVETSAFSIGGWIVELVSAIAAVIIDALTYMVSAFFLMGIRKAEAPLASPAKRSTVLQDIREGLRALWDTPLLRAVAGSAMAEGAAFGTMAAVVLIYGVRELGFDTGVLGTLFAVGGLSSLVGASLTARVTRRFGVGPTMVGGFLLFSLSILLLPAAHGPLMVAAAFLIAQQLGDGLWTLYSINEISLRQAVTPDRMLGRVNAGIRCINTGAFLLGSLLGGVLGEAAGLRWTLTTAAGIGLLGALWLAVSPLRALNDLPSNT